MIKITAMTPFKTATARAKKLFISRPSLFIGPGALLSVARTPIGPWCSWLHLDERVGNGLPLTRVHLERGCAAIPTWPIATRAHSRFA
jgi:hypothetical protein